MSTVGFNLTSGFPRRGLVSGVGVVSRIELLLPMLYVVLYPRVLFSLLTDGFRVDCWFQRLTTASQQSQQNYRLKARIED